MITKIVLISGKQGAGKTTTRENLVKYLEEKGHTTKYIKLAKYLYEAFYSVKKTLGETYGFHYTDKLDQFDGELLQYLGTEYAQRKWGKTVWVDKLCQNILDIAIPREFIVIDDCRFKHEIETINLVLNCNKMKVISVRLEAPETVRESRAEKWRKDTTHPSEIDLDSYTKFDLVIDSSVKNQEQVLDEIKLLLEV